MDFKTLRAPTIAAFAAATACFGGAAVAQQANEAPAAQPGQVQIEPVTDAEISQFVAANQQVGEIATEANAELQAAEDQAAAQTLQAEARQDMIAAIKDEGLTAERFTQIAQLAQMDADFAARLRAEMSG
ncbi:DUF4168 domain-containing protein [Henriciella litoralis]|uniref:DUF4168 domain-containing protein n=1 Tax=Henriciella litoralis TaxID=568102 RepID=UPI00146BE2FD|nr:DUF4168 domain-containing protein [Henriciella litoralis]